MATPPSFTPPKDISGRLGALSVGKMLGVKGSASSVLANSKVRGVLGKKNFSYLKGKANLSSGRIPKHKMIEIIKDVQKTVKSPDRPAGLTNVDTQDKYSTATRVYGRHAREPRLRELANEKANRARSMQAKMEQAREERYKGVVDHRRPNKTGDNRRPD
ncbi:hypothetical protein KKI23_04095, partial [Patescibacteria group bacterium]|nr:hypothetical protein [Patescibacteria group bacterium]